MTATRAAAGVTTEPPAGLDDEAAERWLALAHTHAWNWFALHAAQRQQCLYFFIVATSALVAGFSTALAANRPLPAFAIALIGTVIALTFNLLDRRNRELVKAGEAALGEIEAHLARHTGVAAIALVERAERMRASRATSYSRAVNLLHGLAVGAWVAACIIVSRLLVK